jgi:transmembrane sensor
MDDKTPELARTTIDPPWDDLHERRVLDAVLSSHRAPRNRRPSTLAWSFAAACAAALIAVVTMRFGLEREKPQMVASAPPVETHTLLDGSLMQYAAETNVQVLEQNETSVAISQAKGRVRYDVRHNPDRRFIVRAGAVEVLVVGTVFAVDAHGSHVTVHVEHGRVQVHDGRREVDLSDGEEVQMTAAPAAVAPPLPSAPVEAPERPSGDSAATVQRLLAQADRARAEGNLPQAVTALSAVVNRYPHDPRAVSAWFTLGRVEGQRGRHGDAARAFATCRARSPNGPLAEDALAEEAAAWQKAGEAARAQTTAQKYLEQYPAGAYAARLRPLLE